MCGALQFLTKLEKAMKGIYSEDEISTIMERKAVSLTVLAKTYMKIDNAEPPLNLFVVPVAIEKDVREDMVIEPLKDQVARTSMLLEEYSIEL